MRLVNINIHLYCVHSDLQTPQNEEKNGRESISFTALSSPPGADKPAQTSLWTPSCWTDNSSDSDEDKAERSDVKEPPVLSTYNKALKDLSELADFRTPSQLKFQLHGKLDTATRSEKEECVERATEACKLVCNTIAPDDGKTLFECLPQKEQNVPESLRLLINAFTEAPTRNLKTQILSIYAYEYSMTKLQTLHEPYVKLSKWQIKRARAHARRNGPGVAVIKPKTHWISLDMVKVDHFVDFVNRPYFHQDVAFGMRKLKLESGETIEMPNVVRTVTRSTIVAQYLQFCKDENFKSLSRSTLFRILEVRQASQRKSLQSLDNTAAEGSAAFQEMCNICKQLVQSGMDKTWSQSIINRLDKAKQYLKTDYKVHCQESESSCADHCRLSALNDPTDKDFRTECGHTHSSICENCDTLKSTLNELRRKIEDHKHHLFSQEQRDDLLHDFNQAQQNIMKWKAHILRSINQEKAKQQVLENLDDSSVLIVADWAMKFQQKRFREKQSDWYGKRGMSWHISSVVSKELTSDGKQTVVVTSYAHLFDSCTQDWFSVASIIENLFQTIKTNSPSVKRAFLRSDEAGCYHNNMLVAALKDIGDRVGISVMRYDFSEPQQGKDICDRIICPLKSSVRRCWDEGMTLSVRKKCMQHW